MSDQENFEVDFFSKEETKPLEDIQNYPAYIFTTKLIDVFNDKIKEAKASNSKSVNLIQLKNVYKISSELYDKETPMAENEGHFALARVNMFIRMASEKRGFYKQAKKSKININKSLSGVSDHFLPIEEDYKMASADIEKYGLVYTFQSISELYLEEPINDKLWFEL